ncbi:DUF6506 family protein [Nocardia otitidiscaviarum]|uniref:DUF6506 family protein n=1 Tax=Nocardia otitidiscaviarum TaxID=1823 RepID=UPI001892E51E|nr:DUF6506 family protein [Nocardia otitidiscaviarum]MBF6183393.1 hypothetical protein [Nocardia otitidiscaviarum]
MALTHWASIYYAPGADPERDTRIVRIGDLRNDFIAVGELEQAQEVARQAVADGAQLIELCGAFELLDEQSRDSVAAAIGNAVPVGHVRYSAMDAARIRNLT